MKKRLKAISFHVRPRYSNSRLCYATDVLGLSRSLFSEEPTDDTARPWAWWRHQIETFSALMALCEGNSLVLGEFPTRRPVTQSFDVFFELRLNKRLNDTSRRRWRDALILTSCNGERIYQNCFVSLESDKSFALVVFVLWAIWCYITLWCIEWIFYLIINFC